MSAGSTHGDGFPWRLVLLCCGAEILTMLGFALVPTLLPVFTAEWGLSATAGGWLGGVYFLGYITAVPLLVSLTDRYDARRIYLAAASVSALALAAFALSARSFTPGLVCWLVAGFGLAGTYMPGLRALTDRLPIAHQSRGTAFYTASFGTGAGLSYLLLEGLGRLLPWPWLFALAAGAVVAAVLLIALSLPPKLPAGAAQGSDSGWAGWRAVLRDRRILAFCGAYCGHNWELFGFRSWLVAYLTWSHLQTPSALTSAPGIVAALATFLAVPASILGNEGAHRWGRSTWLRRVMSLSAVLGLAVALTGNVGNHGLWAMVLLLAYAATMNLDSAAMTAGLLTETPAERRGKALALYACVGFAGGFVGPVAFGIALDAFGRSTSLGWSAGFVTLALGISLARLAVTRIANVATSHRPA
ncbi:MAG TPA: MFS transporter [Azospira sp.]|nr:MFS transporter [Azospira sp.]